MAKTRPPTDAEAADATAPVHPTIIQGRSVSPTSLPRLATPIVRRSLSANSYLALRAKGVTLPVLGDLSAGLYLVVGGVSVGKTITMLAASQVAIDASVSAVYLSTFEPRSPEYPKKGTTGTIPFFDNASLYLDDLKVFFRDKKDISLVVLDSVTLPLKYHASSLREGSGTFAGGMQITDIDFCVQLNSYFASRTIVCLATINSAIISYATQLEGYCEGLIQVSSPGNITARGRGTKRRQRVSLNFKKADVDYVAQTYLGYDASPSRADFIGIR